MKKVNKNIILFASVILIIVFVMFYFITQKKGFHEDEIFSYGSSNYSLDNVYQRYGKKDEVNTIIFDEVLKGSFSDKINNIKHYLKNPKEFMQKYNYLMAIEKPVWKTNEDAKEYLTIQKNDILNFSAVYYNQLRDVHPPLFYFLVHIVSIAFFGSFSKYIIFLINIVFLILSFIVIRKILLLLDREHLVLPITILYGLSIGAISIVLFQRMYQMLIFFVLALSYINLKIIKQDFNIDKNTRNNLMLTVVLGFLTQYYFCIYAAIEFLILMIFGFKSKNIEFIKKYLKYHIICALLGILIFPASIYHIFFSYRGMGGKIDSNFIDRIILYFKEIGFAFSVPAMFLVLALVFCIMFFIFKKVKDIKEEKVDEKIKENKKNLKYKRQIIFLVIPSILYFFIIAKIAPNMSESSIIRYIAMLLPIYSILFVIFLDYIFNKVLDKKKVIVALLIITSAISIYGIALKSPRFLYTEYEKAINIAKENSNKKYIYICDNNFTYISSMPEFLIYKDHLIINENVDGLDFLKEDEKIKNEDEIIVSIKKYMNYEDIIQKVLDNTYFENYEVLGNLDKIETIIYKLY